MNLLYDFVSIGLLGMVAFQDFKYKAVSWILFPVLFLITIWTALQLNSFEQVAEQLMFNLAFVVFQLLILTVYFSVKHRKLINIGNTYLGLGDILFFVVLATSFSFLNFVFVYFLSLFAIAMVFMLYRVIKKSATTQIPLAGGMAVIMIICLLFKNSPVNFNFYDDTFALAFSTRMML